MARRVSRLVLSFSFCLLALVSLCHVSASAQTSQTPPVQSSPACAIDPQSGVCVEAEVTVRGTILGTAATGKTSLPLRDLPMTVDMVSADLIAEQGTNDLVTALKNVPGVNAFTTYGVYEYYAFRGFLDSVQLVDGVRNEGNRINTQLTNIDRIEVLKGPSSALYGGGALGATVNLIRKKPSATPSFDFLASAGSWDTWRGAFGAGGRLGGGATMYRFDAGVEKADGYRHNDATRVTITPSVARRLGDASQLNLYYTFNRDRFSGDAGLPLVSGDLAVPVENNVLSVPRDRNYRTPQDDATSRDHNLQVVFARQLTPAWGFRDTGDAADSRVYVSSRTGDVVMETTRGERFWGYLGPVAHWLYLPILRRNGPLWTQVIIWTSGIGCVMCLAGLLLGLVRYSPFARFRLRGVQSRSPYAGLMMWHHYAGLLFGVITFTWTFSGLLSMGPFESLSNGGLTAAQRQAVTGASTSLDDITVMRVQRAIAAIARDFTPKELTLLFFRGEPYWMGDAPPTQIVAGERLRAPAPARPHRLVSAIRPEDGTFARFDDTTIEGVARGVMPGVSTIDATWLHEYDAYYYDRRGARPLPVLRVRYADAEGTWLYFDPRRGGIALISRPGGRLDRWLYQGLHSLDFPVLFYRRPLWDIVVIVLSLGGITLGVTTLKPAWIRLRRHVARATGMTRVRLSLGEDGLGEDSLGEDGH